MIAIYFLLGLVIFMQTLVLVGICRTNNKLNELKSQVSTLNDLIVPSIGANVENTIRDLLNILLNEELVNANITKSNVAGFDLISSKSRTIIQVTGEYRSDKIRSTIDSCDIEKYEGYRLQFVFLVTGRKRLAKKERCLNR
jgi:hypothetical protein